MSKKIIACICIICLFAGLCACKKGENKSQPDGTAADTDAETTEAAPAEAIDTSAWTWTKAELDCYGYSSTEAGKCYLSFDHPDNFKAVETNDSGEQYRGFFYAETDDMTAATSPLGIYAYFMQGGYGARRGTIEESVDGGVLQEKELGGRTVLFGVNAPTEEHPTYSFTYYLPFDEDEWTRIFIVLADQEEDSAFRRQFEESMNFTAPAE